MNLRHLVSALGLSVLLAGCTAEASEGSEAQATTVAAELETLLKGVTSTETAEAAKSELTTMIDKLKNAMPKMPTAEEGKSMLEGVMEEGKKAASAMSGDFTKALGNVSTEIKRILGNGELSGVLKEPLEQLQGVIAGK